LFESLHYKYLALKFLNKTSTQKIQILVGSVK